MFRRKLKSRNSFSVLNSSNRGSDIVRPNNTSLVVNESVSVSDLLPRELTSIFSEDDDDDDVVNLGDTVRSSSLMKSLSQKKQSTPLSQAYSEERLLIPKENICSQAQKSESCRPLNKIFSSGIENISYIDEVLKACGATPLPDNSSFLMSEDQAVFSLKVNQKLSERVENLHKFLSSVKEKITDLKFLQKMLAHTLTAENCEVARGPVQDSLLRMLLNVECLQTNLIEILLDTAANCIVNDKMESENINLISSILCQMKFLRRMSEIKIASKLLEIIDVATVNVKKEVIFLLPEIISEDETEDTCIQLVEMLKYDEALTHVIVDALTNLPLNKALRSIVCPKVIQRLDKCPLEFLPTLVQFVLNKSKSEELNEVINGLRNNLPFSIQHYQMRKAERKIERKHSDDDSFIKLTFENLKFSIMASKEMSDTWLKIISDFDSLQNFRCIDLIMLLIFYSCLFGKKSQILQLLRNKIKSRVLTSDVVENTFKILLVVVEEYGATVLEVASILLKSFDSKISRFGAVLYKECFIHFHLYMKQIVISEMLLHVGTGTSDVINTTLLALKELCENKKEDLSQHTASIMGLLVKVSDLDLSGVQLLLDVIADLVFFESVLYGTATQDELQIFIRKQLMSSTAEQCKKGVLAAVMFGKHAGKEWDCEGNDHRQINSLLEVAMGSSGASVIKRGFFNDEFATMASKCKLSKSFLQVWSKKAFDILMKDLFVENIGEKATDGIDFTVSAQYPIDGEDVPQLSFLAVDSVIKASEKSASSTSVPVIPSSLRFFWSLEKDLNKIMPIFYASVIMPDTTVYDNFNDFDERQKRTIMNCLFLCGNYLIECVNALCVHGILDKAVVRVKQLISVRKLIAKYFHQTPGFVPPLCQFYSTPQKVVQKKKVSEKKGKNGRKRKLSEMSRESETSSLLESQIEKTPVPAPAGFDCSELPEQEADLNLYSSYFRELDFFTYKLLGIDLKSDTDLTSSQDAMKFELETCDIVFLLEDLIQKCEKMFKSTEPTFNYKSKPDVSLVQMKTPEEFVVGSLETFPVLLSKIEIFSKHSENLLGSNNWNYSSRGLYVPGTRDVKLALAAGLKYIANILSWQGFHNSNKVILQDFLSTMVKRVDSNKVISRSESLEALAVAAASYLATFSKTILVLSGGLSIVKSYQACLQYSCSESCSTLADLCHEFLCRNWFTVAGVPEKGAIYNQNVYVLLKVYFSFVDNKLDAVRASAQTALDELREVSGKDFVMKTFKTINKNNFALFYRALCEALTATSTSEFSSIRGNNEKQLNLWNIVVETLMVLVETAKIHSSRAILSSLLKRCQSIIQLFLTKGMPVVESALRVKSVEVLTLLKSFQMVTRFLHSICCHSRTTNDSVVAAHVPGIRSLCERLTLEVKGMLILNGIPMDCITIAILKNRDIKGNDIISQETFDEDSDDDSELPPEDTPDDEDNDNELGGVESQVSNSEVY